MTYYTASDANTLVRHTDSPALDTQFHLANGIWTQTILPNGMSTVVTDTSFISELNNRLAQLLPQTPSSVSIDSIVIPFVGAPTGSCTSLQIAVDTNTGKLYSCSGGAWQLVGSGGIAGNVSIKPLSSDAVQYVTANGNDSNDGLSYGSAKLTVYAALLALPGGSVGPPMQAGSGTLYLGPSVGVGASDGGGLRLVGGGSSEYASPPTGWMRAPSSLYVEGCGTKNSGSFGSGPQCTQSWGSGSTMPAVWINGSSGGITFDGFNWHYQGTAIRLGVDSTGNRNNGGAQNIHFRNFSASGGGSALGWGPQVDIGSNVFWCYFDDCSVAGSIEQWSVNLTRAGNVVTATIQSGVAGTGGATHDLSVNNNISIYATSGGDTSFNGTFVVTSAADNQHFQYNQSAPDSSVTGALAMGDKIFGMTVNPGSGAGTGLIEINRWTGTGIKFYGGASGGSIRVVDLTVEAPFIVNPPGVWISGAAAGAFVSHVELADVTGNTACLVVDSVVNPRNVFAEFLAGGSPGIIDGKVYFGGFQYGGVVSSSTGGMSSVLATPTRAGAFGIIDGHVYAQHDGGRRLFSPAAVRYTNLAKFSSANWFFNDTGGQTHTLTTGISAPDGTTGASQVAIAASGQCAFSYHAAQNLSVTVAVGQWFIGGVWVQSQTANGFQSNAAGLFFQLNGSGNYLSQGIGYQGIGLHSSSWEWVWFAYKVLGASTPSTSVAMYSRADSTHTIQAYSPVLIQVPSGDLSDNEASDLAMHMASYSPIAVPGDVSMVQGQRLLVPRLKANLGTAYSGADAAIVLSAGWGNTAAVSAAAGFDQAFSFSVTSNGTGIAANPTITVTFKDGTWITVPQYQVQRNDLASPFGAPPHTWAEAATALTITFNGTPVAGNVYKFKCMAIGN